MTAWDRVHRTQGRLTIVACLVGIVAGLSGWTDVGLRAQLLWLAPLVVLFGLPHGALDPLVARERAEAAWGRRWIAPFLVLYLLAVGLVLVLWWALPKAALVSFLLLSILHFALGDESRESAPRHAERLVAGSTPIVFPCAFWSEEVTAAFNLLLPAQQALAPEAVGLAGAFALVPVGSAALAAAVSRCRDLSLPGSGGRRAGAALALLFLRSTLFVVAPPLIAFAIYFCLDHSSKHLLQVARQLGSPDASRALPAAIRSGLPLTIVTALFAAASGVAFWSRGLSVDAAIARPLFIGLSALTVPHMIVCWLCEPSDDAATPLETLPC
ncbi:MAG: Brp/Blh family beta-carotene 15,15'-dioxygenase [Acidobacteriota bacterium]